MALNYDDNKDAKMEHWWVGYSICLGNCNGMSDNDLLHMLMQMMDRSHEMKLDMETVVMGPGDIAQAHQPDEYLALERLSPTVDIIKQLVHTVCVRAGPLI